MSLRSGYCPWLYPHCLEESPSQRRVLWFEYGLCSSRFFCCKLGSVEIMKYFRGEVFCKVIRSWGHNTRKGLMLFSWNELFLMRLDCFKQGYPISLTSSAHSHFPFCFYHAVIHMGDSPCQDSGTVLLNLKNCKLNKAFFSLWSIYLQVFCYSDTKWPKTEGFSNA